ncbi:MAG: hypothetical protein IK080_05870 [Clostridia bacterium]|nr:hypothetical protein [Clostridia bacterium]
MEKFVFAFLMIGLSAFFTGLGVFAWKREKPMWFWSGSTVSEDEITDIPAYNRANGIMWIAYSGVFWLSTVIGFFKPELAGPVLAVGCVGGIPVLVIAYKKIYNKYKAD